MTIKSLSGIRVSNNQTLKSLSSPACEFQKDCVHLYEGLNYLQWISVQISPTSTGAVDTSHTLPQLHLTTKVVNDIFLLTSVGVLPLLKYLTGMLHNTDKNTLLQKLVPVEFCAMFRQGNGREGQSNKMLKPLNVYILNIYL